MVRKPLRKSDADYTVADRRAQQSNSLQKGSQKSTQLLLQDTYTHKFITTATDNHDRVSQDRDSFSPSSDVNQVEDVPKVTDEEEF